MKPSIVSKGHYQPTKESLFFKYIHRICFTVSICVKELFANIFYNESGNGVVNDNPQSEFPITGTAKFIENGDSWGGKKRNAIHLNYSINVDNYTYAIKDTLVIRDCDVRFETFNPVVVQN